MHILHIATAMSWRGGEQQVSYLIDELLQKDIAQTVLCSKGSKMEAHCIKHGIDHYAQKKRSGFDLAYALVLKQLCKELVIDLCHLHDAHAHTFAIIAAVMGNKTPLILSRRVDFPIKKKWTSRFKYNHAAIKKVLCVSDAIKQIAAQGIEDKRKLQTVYSGIDLEKFAERDNQLHQELGLEASIKLVGNTSALADHKDYFTFMDTAEILNNKRDDLHFVVMGDGPLRTAIEAYSKEKQLQDCMTFLGFRKDVPQRLAAFDVFLMTSKTEGLGTSLLDAFAAKVPVVATAAGGIPELVKDQETGLLRPIGNATALAEGVERILDDGQLRQKVVKQAYLKVQSFSKAETAMQTLRVYQEVLAVEQ